MEEIEEKEKIENIIKKNLEKFMNRVVYSKLDEQE
jgi:hypothetical protein